LKFANCDYEINDERLDAVCLQADITWFKNNKLTGKKRPGNGGLASRKRSRLKAPASKSNADADSDSSLEALGASI